MTKITTLFAATLFTGALSAAAFAMPAPVTGTAPAPAATTSDIQLAQNMRRDRDRRWRYDRRYHGDRCRHRGPGCRHYRNGWYYNDQWWLGPAIIGGAIIGSQLGDDDDDYDGRNYSSRHVDWCSDRYKSYNPRNNTWLSYSGRYRQCNSPYN